MALPHADVRSDFHCVTRWSTFDNRWEGIPVREILKRVRPRPDATHVMVLGHVGETRYGYTTNLPLADLDRADNLFAFRRNGVDLEPDHGWPLRLDRAAPVRVEELQVGTRAHLHGSRQGRLLGAPRLPHVRRPVPRAAVLGVAADLC